MSSVKILDKNSHSTVKIDVSQRLKHAAEQNLMPVMLSEFQRCAIHFPIILTKNADTGKFTCAAMFGFEKGENLFWKEGKWDALYEPLNIQRQPFLLANLNESDNEPKPENFVFCIDENSPCVTREKTGQALFDNGEPTDYLKQMQKTLAELLQGEKQVEGFVNTMREMDLISPLSLDITFNNDDKQRIDGVYTIDEEKLNSLNDSQVCALHKSGYLGVIYTVYVSLGQLYPLIERKNTLLEKANDWFKAVN